MEQICGRVLCLVWLLNLFSTFPAQSNMNSDFGTKRNNRPIIGILAQQRDDDESMSYIAAPYVTHMAASGARVVPVLLHQTKSYYRRIINSTNGLIIPGGHRSIHHSYFRAAAHTLFHLATEANDHENYYPIYGVCLGFELTSTLILQQWSNVPHPNLLTFCSAKDITTNLTFHSNPKDSRIFRDAPPGILHTLTNESVTPNFHQNCITPSTFNSSKLYRHLRILSTSFDSSGLEFVSTFESINASRPIYLLQWHPEKIMAEFKVVSGEQESVHHTQGALAMTQYLGNFIVGEARRNLNKYKSSREENNALIFNCPLVYTMGVEEINELRRDHFTQFYLFPTEKGCGGQRSKGGNGISVIVGVLVLVIVILIVILTVGWIYVRREGYKKLENSCVFASGN